MPFKVVGERRIFGPLAYPVFLPSVSSHLNLKIASRTASASARPGGKGILRKDDAASPAFESHHSPTTPQPQPGVGSSYINWSARDHTLVLARIALLDRGVLRLEEGRLAGLCFIVANE